MNTTNIDLEEFKPYFRSIFCQVTDRLESGIRDRETLESEFSSSDLEIVLHMAESGFALSDFNFELPEDFWETVYQQWKWINKINA